jgi:FixJ family two-component response regulator
MEGDGIHKFTPVTAIAKRLGISRKTLDIHHSRVIDKMAARTWADLVR